MQQINKTTTKKNATISAFKVERIPLPGSRTMPKLIITVTTPNNREFEISEAIIKKGDEEICQGLWVNLDKEGKVAKKSTLNSLLNHFKVDSIEELKGKPISIKPNSGGYFAVYCVD